MSFFPSFLLQLITFIYIGLKAQRVRFQLWLVFGKPGLRN